MMKIEHIATETKYFVIDEEDGHKFKVVRYSLQGHPDHWEVWASLGVRPYARKRNPNKDTHKRVVAGVLAALGELTTEAA